MDKNVKIYVAGHRGLVGSAIVKKLHLEGYTNIVVRTRDELDLINQVAVEDFFVTERPEYVIDSAAKVGSIKANMTYPAEFMYYNLQIQNNLMWSAKKTGVKKFLFISSSVIYSQDSKQPMHEGAFDKASPDEANEAYVYSKIAGMKLCSYINKQYGIDFISCTPTNIYGEKDNFDPETAHVIPSLIRRIHEAKTNNTPEVTIWGNGDACREFLYVDDLADALVWLLINYRERQFINIGTGEDLSIKDLALKISKLIDYRGDLIFDSSKPSGVQKRLLDVSKLHKLGWKHNVKLDDGIKRTYDWYLNNIASNL